MKIYGMADVHLGIRNANVEAVFERNFHNCIKNIYDRGEESIVLIAGDFFDAPIIRLEVMNNFLKIVKEFKDRVKFVISSGNHDSSPIKEYTTLNTFNTYEGVMNDPVYTSDSLELFVYNDFSDMPIISTAVEKYKRIILESEEIIIDSLPFYMNSEKFSLNKEERSLFERKGYKNILLCHGVTEENDIFKEDEIINKSYLRKRDFILKGHIHKIFSEKINGATLYSPGSLNNDSSKAEGVYLEIYDSNSTKLKEEDLTNLEDTGENTDIDYFTLEVLNPLPKDTIVYKFFNNESPETINETLKSLGKNDIVTINYFGDVDYINSEEYMRCYKDCIKFAFIFSDIDLDVSNYAKRNINSLEFISFHSFMEETLEKMKQDSDIETIEKTYNKLKNFTRKESK